MLAMDTAYNSAQIAARDAARNATRDSGAPLRVFVVEDSESIRSRLCGLIRNIDGVAIAGEADSPASATTGILESAPDAVVLDLQLIGGSGMEVLRAVSAQVPAIVFIVLTNNAGPQYRRACMASGASHFLDKSFDFERVGGILAELRSTRILHCNHGYH